MLKRFMRFPQWKSKAFTLSYDDGARQDIRLAGIFKAHGLKCTFNLNSGAFPAVGGKDFRLSVEEARALYTSDYTEIACHGLTHPFFEQLTPSEVVYESATDKANLEKYFGGIVRGLAYPYGTYSAEVINILRSVGICWARTVEATHSFELPSDWMRLNPTCRHADKALNELADKFLALDVKRQPQMFYLWGHSFEFDNADNWQLIEDFSAKIGGKPDIWYATNGEIYDYTEAYGRLLFSADGNTVFNPTSFTLYFTANDKNFCIKPGETLKA